MAATATASNGVLQAYRDANGRFYLVDTAAHTVADGWGTPNSRASEIAVRDVAARATVKSATEDYRMKADPDLYAKAIGGELLEPHAATEAEQLEALLGFMAGV